MMRTDLNHKLAQLLGPENVALRVRLTGEDGRHYTLAIDCVTLETRAFVSYNDCDEEERHELRAIMLEVREPGPPATRVEVLEK